MSRPTTIYEDGRATEGYEITAGAHRFEAARQERMEDVNCIIEQDDDLHAEPVMIDENLCRAELGPAERAAQRLTWSRRGLTQDKARDFAPVHRPRTKARRS